MNERTAVFRDEEDAKAAIKKLSPMDQESVQRIAPTKEGAVVHYTNKENLFPGVPAAASK